MRIFLDFFFCVIYQINSGNLNFFKHRPRQNKYLKFYKKKISSKRIRMRLRTPWFTPNKEQHKNALAFKAKLDNRCGLESIQDFNFRLQIQVQHSPLHMQWSKLCTDKNFFFISWQNYSGSQKKFGTTLVNKMLQKYQQSKSVNNDIFSSNLILFSEWFSWFLP